MLGEPQVERRVPVGFGRPVFQGAGQRGKEVGTAKEEGFGALGDQDCGDGGGALEDGRERDRR